ncbi:MAG: hypothetical protein ACOCXH_08240 [Cyclobacteriaceae bacterium]
MKTLTITFLALLISLASFANDNKITGTSEVTVSAKKIKNGFSVKYSSAETGKATIKFFDQADHLVHTEKIKNKTDWEKTYFFSDKMNVKTMIIEDESGLHFKELSNINGEIVVNNTKSYQLEKINDKVYLQVKGDNMAAVHVRIYDENRKLVHRETINERKDFVKSYNINNIKPGPVYFVVNDYDATFFQNF